jgi:hypothetical protein
MSSKEVSQTVIAQLSRHDDYTKRDNDSKPNNDRSHNEDDNIEINIIMGKKLTKMQSRREKMIHVMKMEVVMMMMMDIPIKEMTKLIMMIVINKIKIEIKRRCL